MAIKDVTFQTLSTSTNLAELSTVAPQTAVSPPRLWIGTSIFGAVWLQAMSLDLQPLLSQHKEFVLRPSGGVVMHKIHATLSPGKLLSWTVFTSFNVPQIKAVLQISNKKFLVGSKNDYKEGTYWHKSVVIHPNHL